MKLGFSIFMNAELTEKDVTFIKRMATQGFSGIFTSMHVPEDDYSIYNQRLKMIGSIAKEDNLSLMVDISNESLNIAGFSLNNLEALIDMGVTGLRVDYGIDNDIVAKISQRMTVGLNASTLTPQDVRDLRKYDADFSNLEAWHNYYPRVETGLDSEWFREKNKWLKDQGFLVQAFVPGDAGKRGPIYEGLSTLESHRNLSPFAAAVELFNDYLVDSVYIGDGVVTENSLRQFNSYLFNGVVLLHAQDIGSQYYKYILGMHENRADMARDVIRSANSRIGNVPTINEELVTKRAIGSVTIDNLNYLRYMGEIQICKRNLPADKRVNVVGQIIEDDLALLPQVKAGTKFKIEME